MQTNIRNVDLNLLVALEALYEERNVSRAAKRLSLTQPTVSGMLKRLRGMFNDDLFVRTSHGIVPTPRAEAMIEPVKEIIATAQSLLVQNDFEPQTADFSVTLCGSEYTLNTLLCAFAGEISKLAPYAKISLLLRPPGNTEAMMARGEIDFLITVSDTAISGLPTKTLYCDQLVCISSYDAHVDGQRISLESLCEHRHIILNPLGAPISKVIDKSINARGMTRHLVMDVPNFAAVFHAMRNAEMVAFVPEQMALMSQGPFKRLQTDLEPPEAKVIANWHPRLTNEARHIWLRSLLTTTVEKIMAVPQAEDQ